MGDYVLGSRLGRGGMGVVHEARDRAGRSVAIKLLHPHLSDDPQLTRMFYDEATVASRVDHPNVCEVHDFGRQGDLLYLAMERLHGTTLAGLCAMHGPLPIWLAARVIADAARGLHAAHELTDDDGVSLGVVHRDVSPQNVVVLYEGRAKLLDFGVARARGRMASTAQGVLKGKLTYMAPEQVEELPLDRRADVWSLGVVLWEALTGRRLFERGSHLDVVRAVMTADVPPVRSLRPDCPEGLVKIIDRALQEEPICRFATAAAMADALEAFLADAGERSDAARVSAWMHAEVDDPGFGGGGVVTDGAPTKKIHRPRQLRRRERLAWTAVGLLAVALLFSIAWLTFLVVYR